MSDNGVSKPLIYRRGMHGGPSSRDHIPKAVYREPQVPEEAGNPFALAIELPLEGTDQINRRLSVPFVVTDEDRARSRFWRQRRLMGIRRAVQPLGPLEQCYNSISLLLHEGYIGRNPLLPRHLRERPQPNKLMAGATGLVWVVLGRSGVGKTTALETAFSLYQQVKEHVRFQGTPFCRYQIAYLKMNCGSNAIEFCSNAIMSVDEIIETTYAQDLGIAKKPRHVLLDDLCRILDIHGVGTLCIDDLQNLLLGRSDDLDMVMETIVRLVNVEKIPLVLVATEDGLPLLKNKFDKARRASGLPTLVIRPMPYDANWEVFSKKLWRMRLVVATPEMPEGFASTLHDLSRGIVDIAVKLMHFAQHRSLAFEVETLDVSTLQETYAAAITLLQSTMENLKGDPFATYDSKMQAVLDPDLNPGLLDVFTGPGRPVEIVPVEDGIPARSILEAAPAGGGGRKPRRAKRRQSPVVQLVAQGQIKGISAHESLLRAGIIWKLGEEATES